MKILSFSLVMMLMTSSALAQEVGQPEETFALKKQPVVKAEKYMVSAANPLAVEVGYEVLKAGGSAIDAAIATQFMLNLVEPQSSGIGGGAFLVYWDAHAKKRTTFDGRETAPAAATPDYWMDPSGQPMKWWDAVVGGRSVGVPGTLKLLEAVHKRYGKQAWADLITPTITKAKEGFTITPRLASAIAKAQEKSLDLFPETKAYFFEPDGSPKKAGTLLKNEEFAESLSKIAKEGSKAFYQGTIATDIVNRIKTEKNPGILTVEDFSTYEIKERQAVCAPYRAYEVCGMGPPSSGALTVGQILGILEHFDMEGIGATAHGFHLLAEASKLAFADRNLYMADSDFISMPTKGLLSKDYLMSRAQLVNQDQAMEKAKAGAPSWKEAKLWAVDTQPERAGTSHISVVDAAGNVVSMTTTIETGFGSRLMTGGFLLNNELTDFSLAPSRNGRPIANRVEGGKRPRSSMSPTIVFKDGQPVLAIGSPGGSRIIGYVAQSLVSLLDWKMTPEEALRYGHIVNRNGATDVEEKSQATAHAEALTAAGHKINIRNLNSGLHGILISKTDGLLGFADPRREGTAMGD